MKVSRMFAAAAIVSAALIGTQFQAQNAPAKVGMINTDAVFQAHPKYKELQDVTEKAAADLEKARVTLGIDYLATKAQAANATAKDKQDFQTARDTYEKKAKDWQTKVDAIQNPVDDSVNNAIAQVAKAQGFSLLLSRKIAAQGLVVYADEGTVDVTEAVKKALK